ncbi:MAG: aminoacyl-tRNA hydrolase [Anaerolineae bacterium CG_4_9_14_0_8_um_filter_58_9]|nr:MAG: aminoacyl-tRNA hydrolase [Anaerolineae bacterium CG_4_9_14_0_8_um_filter_58_9]
MIAITPSLALDESEIQFEFVRAAGPGGQNVNKVSTAVQLRFDVHGSPSLPAEVKARLVKLAGRRVSEDGILVITARRYRSQEQNRADAVQRLVKMIQKAATRPRVRKATRVSQSAKAARVDEKKRRGQVKHRRHRPSEDWE